MQLYIYIYTPFGRVFVGEFRRTFYTRKQDPGITEMMFFSKNCMS